jgi:hypothetical protein
VYTLIVLSLLGQQGPKAAAPSGEAPTQMVAGIDSKGMLRLTFAMPMMGGCYGSSPYAMTPAGPPGYGPGKVPTPAPPKVKIRTVMVTTAEMSAKDVTAYTADGRTIPAERLATLLAKERPVLVALDGKKVDPFLLQLYKDDTLILVPPANTLNMGMGYGGYSAVVPGPAPYGAFPEKVPVPAPRPERLPELKKPLPDGRRP